ncbi:MAG: lipoprotein insertase outer membrane protein LolB [Pseudohaliea sp.]
MLARTATVALCLCLAACAGRELRPPPGAWAAQRPQLEQLERFRLQAKVALRWPAGAETARLSWEQRGENTDLTLAGPFGAGAVAIQRRGALLEIRDGDSRRTLPADDPAALAAATGWPVPVDALAWWLRGLPDPAGPRSRITWESGLPERLEQGGWTVTYGRFGRVDGLLLPQALTLRYPAGALELRLAAAQWQPGAAE